jgi:predicted transcriptional regulator
MPPIKKKRFSLKDFLNPDHSVIDIAATPIFSVKGTDPVGTVLSENIWRSRRVIVRDRHGSFLGMLTSRDILDFLGGGTKRAAFKESGLKTRVSRIMDSEVHQLSRDHSVHDALDLFKKHGRDAHPITENGRIVGLLSETDFIRNIEGPTGVTVSEVMTKKPFTITDKTSISEAALHLTRGAFKRIPVLSSGVVTGIVTPHDILSSIEKPDPKELRNNESPVRRIMNRAVISTKPERDVHEAVKAMKRTKLGFLPVVDDADFVGIITERDILEI